MGWRDSLDRRSEKQVASWLLVCCGLVFGMVVLGGVTRLTRSGLSMVEWAPIMGAIPPLNLAEWQEAFSKYQLSPEFRLHNSGMDLEGFKEIFLVEYAHRLMGRSIGVVFFLPFLYFLLRRKLSKPLIPKLLLMLLLGGLQGGLGWYMVKSGLVNVPQVSQYRLVAHLSAAFLIYAYMFWVAMGLLLPGSRASAEPSLARLRPYVRAMMVLISLMVISGGFVAGLKAGFMYNTFPLMNGYLIPPSMFALEPGWRNFFENHALVQFNHRLLGLVLSVTIPGLWFYARRLRLPLEVRLGHHLLLGMLIIQVSLGILTLLWVVPVPLAAAHQGGALMLFAIAVFLTQRVRG